MGGGGRGGSPLRLLVRPLDLELLELLLWNVDIYGSRLLRLLKGPLGVHSSNVHVVGLVGAFAVAPLQVSVDD